MMQTNYNVREPIALSSFCSWCWIGLFLALIATYGLPKLVYEKIMIAGVPLYHYFLAAFLVSSGVFAISNAVRHSRWLVLWGCVFFWLVVCTAANRQGVPFYIGAAAMDFAVLMVIVASSLLVIGLDRNLRSKLFILVTWLQIFQLAGIDLLTLTGVIAPEHEGARLTDYSMWALSMGISVLLPVVVANYLRCKQLIFAILVLASGVCVTLTAGVVSQTRSVTLGILLSAIVCCWVFVRQRGIKNVAWLALPSVGVALLLVGLMWNSDFMFYFQERLMSRDTMDDPRIEEMFTLWSQISSTLLFGFGTGRFFASPIGSVEMGAGLAAVPHIGVLTPLVKGGIPLMLTLVVWPLWVTLKEAFVHRGDAVPFSCGILVYIAIACISGGWHYSQTAILGILAGGLICSRETDMAQHKTRPRQTLARLGRTIQRPVRMVPRRGI